MPKLLLLLLLASCALPATKADAADADEFNWQLAFGFGVSHGRNLIADFDNRLNGIPQLQIHFDFEYKNWFAETTGVRSGYVFGDPALGYRLFSGGNYNLAIIATSYHFGFGPDNDQIRTRKLEGLDDRSNDLITGLRYQRQLDDKQLFSVQLTKDIIAHHGEILSLFYGHRFEYNNWDLYLNTELSWHSAKLVNYYYGISARESRPERPEYRAGSGWRQHYGVVGVYPLHTKWVMELGAGVNWYSRAHTNSPLTRNKPELQSFVIFRYVYK